MPPLITYFAIKVSARAIKELMLSNLHMFFIALPWNKRSTQCLLEDHVQTRSTIDIPLIVPIQSTFYSNFKTKSPAKKSLQNHFLDEFLLSLENPLLLWQIQRKFLLILCLSVQRKVFRHQQ